MAFLVGRLLIRAAFFFGLQKLADKQNPVDVGG
jgi:hypothetical protein